tara:strand:- start:2547 stop:2861 length:315 start_codon:yes stop_codon:yes gene_type:complete
MGWKPLHELEVLKRSVPPHPDKYAKYDKYDMDLTPIQEELYNKPLWEGLILYIHELELLLVSLWPDEDWREDIIEDLGFTGDIGYFTVEKPYKYAPNTGWMIRH